LSDHKLYILIKSWHYLHKQWNVSKGVTNTSNVMFIINI